MTGKKLPEKSSEEVFDPVEQVTVAEEFAKLTANSALLLPTGNLQISCQAIEPMQLALTPPHLFPNRLGN
jgi:hypothetical protein